MQYECECELNIKNFNTPQRSIERFTLRIVYERFRHAKYSTYVNTRQDIVKAFEVILKKRVGGGIMGAVPTLVLFQSCKFPCR